MLTVMCPYCRHRFSAPGCCETNGSSSSRSSSSRKEADEEERRRSADTVHPAASFYAGGLLVPRGYTSGGGCFINAPTIIHGPAVFQSDVVHRGSTVGIASSEMIDHGLPGFYDDIKIPSAEQCRRSLLKSPSNNDPSPSVIAGDLGYRMSPSERYVAAQCDLIDSNITIATPAGIQSGGCLIQSTEAGFLLQTPHVEIRPRQHTGGGCLLQKRLSTEDERLIASEYMEEIVPIIGDNAHRTFVAPPPSGCLELPGNRGTLSSRTENSGTMRAESRQQKIPDPIKLNSCYDYHDTAKNLCQCRERSFDASHADDRNSLVLGPVNGGVQIQVNATLQLPANMGECRVNITATTTTPSSDQTVTTDSRGKNNFYGGGIVQSDESNCTTINLNVGNCVNCNKNNEQKDEAPTTPLSWLMPCPWGLDAYLMDKDLNKLRNVKRLLQTCGWYHEGISWQQSESLLKDAPTGRWLMRDSSDSRYIFAVSVQTARGPTSIRVHYFFGRFRLDAEPRLALAMPLFDCPIRMLEHYVDYSKRIDEHRREVWVDYSGQLYSQIYLTKPLVKEVRSLSHLARLAVNRNKLPTEHLPHLIRNYLVEYPYTL